MTKFRWHRGALEDSMKTVIEVRDRRQLEATVIMQWSEPISSIDVRPYGYDGRIDWGTHIVTDNRGQVLGYTDGPI